MSRATKYKIIGGFLFLTSFMTQNFIYDYWEGESTEFYNSNKDFSAMIRSSLHYQNLYFNLETNDSFLDSTQKLAYIKTAARKVALGNMTSLSTSGLETDTIIKLSNSIMNLTANVVDYPSFIQYTVAVNSLKQSTLGSIRNRVNEVKDKKEIWRYIFLTAYIFGSLLILMGTFYEEKLRNK